MFSAVSEEARIGWGYTFALDESWFMVLLVNRSGHEMIWLPDGDVVPDRTKHIIQTSKLMPKFVQNFSDSRKKFICRLELLSLDWRRF
jgi:hypothetical protein